jgi:hypothetical protein
MHCPNCGSEAPMEQKFCRSCGFALGKVARLIAEQASGENLDSASDPKEELLKRLRRVRFMPLIGMFLMFGCYLAININEGVGVFGGVVFFYVVVLLLLLTLGIYIGFVSKRPGDRKSPRPASLINAPTTKKLPPQPDPEMNASVTEQTTANLAERIEN